MFSGILNSQTPCELRTRTNRLADFDNVEEIEATLNKLHDLNNEQLVIKLEREPGKRDARYGHLFSGDEGLQVLSQAQTNTAQDATSIHALERIKLLEQQVSELISQLAELKETVEILSE
jgi:uncharacterized protein YceH (UPF0502 family)